MKRIYHNHDKWEEYHFGMWKSVYSTERDSLLQRAIKFTGDAEEYGKYMIQVVKEWKYSCEHNLTNLDINRQAWIGHAACCLAIKCPEDITRLAWHSLTQDQQDRANKKADEAISLFEQRLLEREDKCQKNIYQLTFFPLLVNG